MSFNLFPILGFLLLHGVASQDLENFTECRWEKTTNYVRASVCDYPTIRSCRSFSINPLTNAEVHIIHISSSGLSPPHHHPPTRSPQISEKLSPSMRKTRNKTIETDWNAVNRKVEVYLQKPFNVVDSNKNNTSLIIILSSDVQLTWGLLFNEFNNWNINAWLTRNTRLAKDTDLKVVNFNPQVNILSWAKKRFGAVTSYLQVEDAVDVVELYTDRGVRRNCFISENSSQFVAYSKTNLPSQTCIADASNDGADDDDHHRHHYQHRGGGGDDDDGFRGQGEKETHIIELLSTPSFPSSTPSSEGAPESSLKIPIVILKFLRKENGKRNQNSEVDVVVIVKSHTKVAFKVTMGVFVGRVVIYTDQLVNSDSDIVTKGQSLAVSAEKLEGLSGKALYNWSVYHHAPPLSYTRVDLANYIEVLIGGKDDPLDSSPFMNAQPITDLQDEAAAQDLLARAGVSITCSSDSLFVSIKKPLWLSCHDLTLSNNQCRASSNLTHCLLEAKYGECKACDDDEEDCYDHDNDSNSKFKNEVILHSEKSRRSQKNLPLLILDCSTLSATATNNDVVEEKGDLHFHLRLYKDETLKKDVLTSLHKEENGGKLFVVATVEPEMSILPIINNCQIESILPGKSKLSSHLIHHGCPTESVKWLGHPYKGKPLNPVFTFNLEDMKSIGSRSSGGSSSNCSDCMGGSSGGIEEYVRVVCKITPCSINSSMTSLEIPQCTDEDYQTCKTPSSSSSSSSPSSSSSSPKHVKVTISSTLFIYTTSHNNNNNNNTNKNDNDSENKLNKHGSDIPFDLWKANEKACLNAVVKESRGDYVSIEMVVIVSFCAFLIGVASMSALWLICVKTRSKKMIGSKHLRSPDTSGESTPSSTSPITICQIKRPK